MTIDRRHFANYNKNIDGTQKTFQVRSFLHAVYFDSIDRHANNLCKLIQLSR